MNVLMQPPLTCVTLNCEGIKSKLGYLKQLCDNVDVICLQETWLMEHEIDTLNNIHPDFNAFSISGVDSSAGILVGRPYGGVSILWKNKLPCRILNYDDCRMLGVMLDCNNFKYLILNVYLPYFSEDNIPDYLMYMGKIESILESTEVNGVMIIGDFNAEPGKLFYEELSRLCQEYDLIISDVDKLNKNSYTHVNNGSLKRSWLDHCVASPCIHNSIIDIYIDNDDTISDHFPMFITLDVQGLPAGVPSDENFSKYKIKWNFEDYVLKDSFYRELCRQFNFHEIPEFSFCNNGCTV